jgi:hypothetical protein
MTTKSSTKKMPAKSGEDYVRGSDWEPMKKTEGGWRLWARQHQSKASKKVGFSVIVTKYDNYYRINYARSH